jgi:hypothetical protein
MEGHGEHPLQMTGKCVLETPWETVIKLGALKKQNKTKCWNLMAIKVRVIQFYRKSQFLCMYERFYSL